MSEKKIKIITQVEQKGFHLDKLKIVNGLDSVHTLSEFNSLLLASVSRIQWLEEDTKQLEGFIQETAKKEGFPLNQERMRVLIQQIKQVHMQSLLSTSYKRMRVDENGNVTTVYNQNQITAKMVIPAIKTMAQNIATHPGLYPITSGKTQVAQQSLNSMQDTNTVWESSFLEAYIHVHYDERDGERIARLHEAFKGWEISDEKSVQILPHTYGLLLSAYGKTLFVSPQVAALVGQDEEGRNVYTVKYLKEWRNKKVIQTDIYDVVLAVFGEKPAVYYIGETINKSLDLRFRSFV